MKRFRLSTLMLLVVIAALSVALIIQRDQASRRQAELAELKSLVADLTNLVIKITEREARPSKKLTDDFINEINTIDDTETSSHR